MGVLQKLNKSDTDKGREAGRGGTYYLTCLLTGDFSGEMASSMLQESESSLQTRTLGKTD